MYIYNTFSPFSQASFITLDVNTNILAQSFLLSIYNTFISYFKLNFRNLTEYKTIRLFKILNNVA